MGQFSWLDCKTKEQIIDNKYRYVYVLVPKEFGGGHIVEYCYDGYGNFGGNDIYDLVADWNRENVTHYNFEDVLTHQWAKDDISRYTEGLLRQVKKCERLIDFKNNLANEKMVEKYGKYYKREIGIDIACYDEQNAALKYPIKITHDKYAIYEECEPSLSDPNQGWEMDEDDWY